MSATSAPSSSRAPCAGRGWDEQIQLREEVTFTRGRVIVRGRITERGQAKQADYALYYKPNIPLAVIQAKDYGSRRQTCRVIALDREIGSMTSFKQIVGRRTRIHEDTHKLHFTLTGFRNRVAMPKINQETLGRLLVSVPPLDEQIRIGRRAAELMTICDELDSVLATDNDIRARSGGCSGPSNTGCGP